MEIITTTLFWQFVCLNFINVLVSTARSICTIKGGKWLASIMNAICYGYYTVIIVITATYDMPIITKCIAVAFVNFIGVFTVKFCEEKIRKPSLWIYNTVGLHNVTAAGLIAQLDAENIKFIVTKVEENFNNFEIFSETTKDSITITTILDDYPLKYYATEAKEKNSK